ncbi:hypothetical protein [Streptomyces sp. NPDC054794]
MDAEIGPLGGGRGQGAESSQETVACSISAGVKATAEAVSSSVVVAAPPSAESAMVMPPRAKAAESGMRRGRAAAVVVGKRARGIWRATTITLLRTRSRGARPWGAWLVWAIHRGRPTLKTVSSRKSTVSVATEAR